jgi:hypothetical protein
MEDVDDAAAAAAPSAAAAAATFDGSTTDGDGPYSGPGEFWPKWLHLTFDNAPSECKNQWMLRFLGLFVFHGVFQAITLSMLLVGHTHDIVDQMFSVWARTLRISDAPTYEKMRDLFRERYHSRIAGLVDLMRNRRDAAVPAQDLLEMVDADSQLLDQEQAQILEDFSDYLKLNDMQPHIEQQHVSCDIQGWLTQAVDGILPPLPNLKKAYNYAIEKDTTGNVYLYCRQFEKSAERNDGVEIHRYPGQQTGDYTTRALLYRNTDPGLFIDPYRVPPLAVDTKALRQTVDKYVASKAMNQTDANDFRAMLDSMDAAQEDQKRRCSTCYDLASAYARHGVISRSKRATDAEKAEANKKSVAKGGSWQAIHDHLRDDASAAVHNEQMLHNGFWTNWLQRERDHIRPAYIQRGIIAPDSLPRWHAPETELCSGKDELPHHKDNAVRADAECMKHGLPTQGQYVIGRTDTPREPFWVGLIVDVRPSDRCMRRAREASAMIEEAPAAESEATPPAPAAAAAAASSSAAAAATCVDLSNLRLKDLAIEVRWFDICPEDFEQLHLDADTLSSRKKTANERYWSDLWTRKADADAEQRYAAEVEAATANRRRPPPRPGWLVDLFLNARFLPPGQAEESETSVVSGAALLWWGPFKAVLKNAKKSKAGKTVRPALPVWRRIREDLTEEKQATLPKPAARKKKAMADGSDEEMTPASATAAAAAAAAPSRSAPARASKSRSRAAPFMGPPSDDERDAGYQQDDDHAPLSSLVPPAAAAAAAAVDSQMRPPPRPVRACVERVGQRASAVVEGESGESEEEEEDDEEDDADSEEDEDQRVAMEESESSDPEDDHEPDINALMADLENFRDRVIRTTVRNKSKKTSRKNDQQKHTAAASSAASSTAHARKRARR